MKTSTTTHEAAERAEAKLVSKSVSPFKSVVALLLAAFSLAACSKEEGSTPIMARDGRAVGAAASGGITALNGWVIANSSQQTEFQNAVSGFVEAALPPEYLGFVSVVATGGTGVFLGGNVELQTGILNTSNNVQTNIRSDSKLLISIYDEFTGRPDANGIAVEPIGRYFTQASGYVQGNRAYLKFTDTLGSVEIDGTFDANTFEGIMTYENVRRYDGQGGSGNVELGWVQVPTCEFFRCR